MRRGNILREARSPEIGGLLALSASAFGGFGVWAGLWAVVLAALVLSTRLRETG